MTIGQQNTINVNENNLQDQTQKFNVGDIVTITGRGGTFHIYDKPSWSKEYNQWLYPYDYGLGGTSEGFGLECNMKLAKDEKS